MLALLLAYCQLGCSTGQNGLIDLAKNISPYTLFKQNLYTFLLFFYHPEQHIDIHYKDTTTSEHHFKGLESFSLIFS